jgi:hypothetical protein
MILWRSCAVCADHLHRILKYRRGSKRLYRCGNPRKTVLLSRGRMKRREVPSIAALSASVKPPLAVVGVTR